MRIALLFALPDETMDSGAAARAVGADRPSFRRFAGKSVLMHQIDCAAHWKCERVICLSDAPSPDLNAAMSYAQRAGMRLEVVESLADTSHPIAGTDTILLVADGVLPDRALLVEALSAGDGVLGFPAEPALAMGFERIDAGNAWAGALQAPGAVAARLAELPEDCDLASALLRIALQSRVPLVRLDAEVLTEGSWQRRVVRQGTPDSEWRWIVRQIGLAPFAAPGSAVTERIGLRWAHDAGGGRWSRAPHVAAAAGGVLALLAALSGAPVAGLVALFAASIALTVAAVFDRLSALGAPLRADSRQMHVARWARDALLIALLAQSLVTVPRWLELALPAMLIGVCHLGTRAGARRLRALFADRIALLVVLMPAAYLGWSTVVVSALLGLGLGVLLLARDWPASRLTAD